MICNKCAEQGERSVIEHRGSTQTLMASIKESFYDENGERHNHNSNKITSYYRCSNNHEFRTIGYKECSNLLCSYGKQADQIDYKEII